MAKKNMVENNNEIFQENLDNLSILDLNAYEAACRMLCFQYEKPIKIDEIERKLTDEGALKENREKFQKYTNLHRFLCIAIENKLNKLL